MKLLTNIFIFCYDYLEIPDRYRFMLFDWHMYINMLHWIWEHLVIECLPLIQQERRFDKVKTKTFIIRVLKLISIILFLLIIMIVVIKKWHFIHQQWIKCLTNENWVNIQFGKTECSSFLFYANFPC